MLRPLLIAAVMVLAVGGVSADAAHAVWSGLVIAENVPQPAAIPPELTKFEQTLKDLFGYNQFEVIGQSNKTLRTGDEDWLAASKYFSLHCDARGESAVQDREELVATVGRIIDAAPHLYGHGNLGWHCVPRPPHNVQSHLRLT